MLNIGMKAHVIFLFKFNSPLTSFVHRETTR